MRLLIISAIFIMASSVHAEDLIILGRLRAIEKDLPHCGLFYIGGVTEYEVLQVISAIYAEKRIFVVHGCIEMLSAITQFDGPACRAFEGQACGTAVPIWADFPNSRSRTL